MPEQIYETMTKVKCGRFTVRVWRNCGKEFHMGPDMEIRKALLPQTILDYLSTFSEETVEYSDYLKRWIKPEHILAITKEKMDINAIEILDEIGNGGLYYPDWP